MAALLALNDAPVDVANFYRGDAGAWGLFSEQGAPNAAHNAMRAFVALLETPRRVPVTDAERIVAAAGVDAAGKRATIVLVNATEPARAITLHARNLPWSGATRVVIRRIDAAHVFENADTLTLDTSAPDVPLTVEGPGVVLVTFDSQTAPASR